MYNVIEVEVENKEIIKESSSERIYYLDILRVMAIIAVILVHVAANPTDEVQFIGTMHWWIADIVNGALRWAIPIFFMISGALLLDSKKEENIVDFYKRSFKRLAIPFFVWSIIYFLMKYYYLEYATPVDSVSMIGVFIKEFLFNQVYSHLWFMYSILTMYFIAPFLRKLVQNLSRQELLFIIGGWVVVSFVYPQICEIYSMITNNEMKIEFFDIPFIMGFSGYFILGYYLKKYELKRGTQIFIYIAGFISAVIVPSLTYLVSIDSASLNERYYEHFVLTSLFMAMALFILIKNVDWKNIFNDRIKMVISSLSASTFGIYFVHLIVESVVLKSLTVHLYKDSLIIIPIYIIYAICNVFVSYMFVKVIGLNSKLKALLIG